MVICIILFKIHGVIIWLFKIRQGKVQTVKEGPAKSKSVKSESEIDERKPSKESFLGHDKDEGMVTESVVSD